MQRPVSLRPLSFPLSRSIPVSLLLLGFFAPVVQAQPPTATAFVGGPDGLGGLWVTVAVGADAPGDATVTVDPLGVGRNTFVRQLVKIAYTGHDLEPCPSNRQCFSDDFYLDSRLPAGQYSVPVTVTDSKGRQTKLVVPFQTAAGRDSDHDGLPDAWEEEYGLNEYSADGDDGPAGDPDGDGVSNLDEYKAGTNPRDKYVRFFAEGSSGALQPLSTCVSVMPLHPSDTSFIYVPVHVTYIGDNGRKAVSSGKVSNWGGGFCPMDSHTVADRVVEIRVESTVELAVEREINSGITQGTVSVGQLANASLGVQSPSRTWTFADGHTAGGMDMFLLLFNPTGAPVNADIAYVRAPSTVIAHTSRVLAPGVRTTIWVNQDQPDALGPDVSMQVTADDGILAERAYRYQSPGRTVPHDSVTRGAWLTSPHWYFPDMDSRGPFTTSLVLMNPSPTPARATVTLQFPDRGPTTLNVALTAGERRELTLSDLSVPAGTLFGAIVDTADGVGIVAERTSTGATASGAWRRSAIGAMQPGTQWLLPTSGGLYYNDTDLVFLNVSDTTARIRIRMISYGFDCCDRSEAIVEVPARGSLHVPIGYNDPARTINVLSSGTMTIDSIANASGNTASIVVERTNYWSVDGVAHARASSVLGNQVQ